MDDYNFHNFEKRLIKAQKRVACMDKIDGFKERSIGTIITALEAGLRETDLSAAFDALVMLKDRDNYDRKK